MQQQYREALRCYERERTLVARRPADEPSGGADHQATPTITAQIGRTYDRMGRPDSARIAYEAALAAELRARGDLAELAADVLPDEFGVALGFSIL